MAKKNIDLSVVLHDDSDYKDWLVELKERFYSHRLKASCATNGYLLDFYWKLGRDIEAKQYANTYGSGFYKNLSLDLKNEMSGIKGFVHRNKKIKELRPLWEQRGLFLFFLPPYSPQLNIAETLWRILKGKWIRPQDYITSDILFYTTNRALADIGKGLRINFSKHVA